MHVRRARRRGLQWPAPPGLLPRRLAAPSPGARPSPGCAPATPPRRGPRSNETIAENLSRRVSGLTRGALRDVEALQAGTPIFLFNVNDKRLHGVFEAVRAPPQRTPPRAAGRRRRRARGTFGRCAPVGIGRAAAAAPPPAPALRPFRRR